MQRAKAEEEAQRHGEMAAERDRLRARCAMQQRRACARPVHTACAHGHVHGHGHGHVYDTCMVHPMVQPTLVRHEKQQAALTEERKRHSDEMASMAARLEAEQLQAAQICAIEPAR